MAERNYKRAYELDKDRSKLIGVRVTPEIFEEFTAKCELNNTTKNAIIKQWIDEYLYGGK